MGTVYRAHDRLQQRTVALKRVSVGPQHVIGSFGVSAGSEAMRVALAHEFRTLASLRHPNVIEVLDYGFDENRQPYFTMTLLDDAVSLVDYGRHCDISDAGFAVVANPVGVGLFAPS